MSLADTPPRSIRAVEAHELRLWMNLLADVAAYLETVSQTADGLVPYEPVHLRLRCMATAKKLEQLHG